MSADIAEALRGVVAVLITPYRHGGTSAVDEEACTALAAGVDAAGVPALTALGNTAEVHRLGPEERATVLRGVAAGRRAAALVAGLTGPLDQLLQEADLAARLGYDAVMVHQPADPFGDGPGQVTHLRELADRSPLPVIPYLRSTVPVPADIIELVSHPAVVGLKYARPDVSTLAELLRGEARDACVWVNGTAEATVPGTAALGLSGFTSGIANARPDAALAVHDAVVAGDLSRLTALLTMLGPVEALRTRARGRHNVAVIKEMLRRQGFEAGGVRAPHAELDGSTARALHDVLDRWPDDLRTPTGV